MNTGTNINSMIKKQVLEQRKVAKIHSVAGVSY